MHAKRQFARRRLLQGLGGVAIGLPALDIFEGRAHAQAATKKIYSALMLQQNGAIQGNGSDADMFWPRAVGAIDANAMATTDADRTTSELKDYASKLVFVRGLNFRYSRNHDGGPIAASCGSPITGTGTAQLPVSESVDFFIANSLTPGKEPLTLYAGRKGTFRDDAFSFSTGGKLRVGDNNPWNVYQRLIGLAGTDPAVLQKIAARRLSVNDLVRAELKELLGRTDLSKADRDRLDLHFSSIRDLEIDMTKAMGPPPDTAGMQAVNGSHTTDANMEKVVNFQLDLIAFAFASDRARTASLQVGGCNDHTKYMINGVQAPAYHFISHRVMSDGGSGDAIANAVELHHQIDLIHARYFKHLLDKLAAYTLPGGGTLLDSSVNLWVNSVSDGPPHSGNNVPHVLAGNAGGFLKTGLHLKTTGYTSKVLSTIASAAGVRKATGDLVDNFGDPSSTGLITEIIA
ncbi:MAG TPA: DUF1552 domain-containing protein [Polyangiaceae bacterium]|nr:DUF1552 domain-containing protein [Polyangiaceae bacterium]